MTRPAQPADAPWIADLWNRVIARTTVTFTTEPKSVAEIEAMISERGPAFVVAPHVGFATYGAFRAGPGYAATVEHTIYVDDRAQGQGVGRALLTALELQARRAGGHVMVAAISGANPQAVAFHRKLGFDRSGLLPAVGRKNGQWLDLLLMTKILGSANDSPAPRG